jgi:hypothetical protein
MRKTLVKVLLPTVIPVALALSTGVASASVSQGHAVRPEPAVRSTQFHIPAGAYMLTRSGVVRKAGKVAAGVKPDATTEYYGEWCYKKGDGPWACLNAWGGGPDVNVYTTGHDHTPNNYFTVYPEPDGFWGIKAANGECIGDRGNASGTASTGLVTCGSGWGSNFVVGTYASGACPNGQSLQFYNEHWKGLLGPPADWSNGDPFYLNKPVVQYAFCFGYYS